MQTIAGRVVPVNRLRRHTAAGRPSDNRRRRPADQVRRSSPL